MITMIPDSERERFFALRVGNLKTIVALSDAH